MTAAWEPYTDVQCPRCGYTEARDAGPYEYEPELDDELGGAPDPRVHLMWCGRCGKPFDVCPSEAWDEIAEKQGLPRELRDEIRGGDAGAA